MKSITNNQIIDLLTRREKIILLVTYLLVVSAICVALIYFDFLDIHHQLDSQHHQSSSIAFLEVVSVSLLVLGVYLVFITFALGRRLVYSRSQNLKLQRSIEQTRHLVAMGKVLGGVSHSVNNHLLPVIALTEEAIGQLDAQSEMAKDLQVVLDAALGAAQILRQLKNFSRQELALRETCSLAPALAKAIDLCENVIPRSMQFYQLVESMDLRVALSETALKTVLLNLVSNAIDAIGDGHGRIGIVLVPSEIPDEATGALRAFSTWISLRVEDSGVGISKEQIEKIFEPFYTTKPEGKGTGLGLSESYGIVKAAGGFIHVESTPGIGSAFVIRLPVLLNEDRQGNSRFVAL